MSLSKLSLRCPNKSYKKAEVRIHQDPVPDTKATFCSREEDNSGIYCEMPTKSHQHVGLENGVCQEIRKQRDETIQHLPYSSVVREDTDVMEITEATRTQR